VVGAFLAWTNNVIEQHSDAFKIVCVQRRPFYKGAQDIGTWALIFEIVNVIGLCNNMALIAFTSNYLQNSGWVSTPNTDDTMVVTATGNETKAEVMYRDPTQNGWIEIIAITFLAEHVLFGVKHIVGYIPDMSEYTQDCAERLAKAEEKILYTGADKYAMRKTAHENRVRYDCLNDVLVDMQEDTDVTKWRTNPRQQLIHGIGVTSRPYSLIRRCTREDYVPHMYVHGDSEDESDGADHQSQ